MTERADPPRRPPRAAAAVLALVVTVALVLAALYAARRQIAREAVTDWLRSRGVASQTAFEEIGPGRLVGRVRLGRPEAPDLVVDRAEIRYSLTGLLAGRGVQVTSIRLTGPVLRARWQGGRFSAGALDPLIAEFRKRPAGPPGPSPRVEVEGATLLLATDYGPVRASGDAVLADGRLVSLQATTAPLRLQGGRLNASLGPSSLEARARGDRLDIGLHAPIERLQGLQASLAGGDLRATLQGPYPSLAAGAPVTAQAAADLRIASGAVGAARLGATDIRVSAPNLSWTRSAGNRLAGDLALQVAAHDLAAGDLHLAAASGQFRGPVALGTPVSVRLVGGAEAAGGWQGLGAPSATDSAEIAAAKRGLRDFRAVAPGLVLVADGRGARASLAAPASLRPRAGGEVRLAAAGGGYRLTAAGGGLPKVDADIRRFALISGGASAAGTIKASLSIGPVQGGVFDAGGELRIQDGQLAFTGSRCAQAQAARLDLGVNDVDKISGRLCPAGGPLVRFGHGGWTIFGHAAGVAAAAPFLQASVTEADGPVRLSDTAGGLAAALGPMSARVRDAAPSERFRPMLVSGRADLAREVWTGALEARLPTGPAVGRATLRHDGRTGAGGVTLATGPLTFAEGALQPADLSPLAEALAPPVSGRADFAGGFQWTKAGVTSGGRLTIQGLDFKSPAGPVSGVAGQIDFTSLAPLITAPGQVLRAARVAAVVPITDISAAVALRESALVVTEGGAGMGGGRLRIERLEIPLKPDATIQGAVLMEGVQLHDLVEASPFGDRMDLDARVSGRVPFTLQGAKIRIAGGDLHAIVPGRLSINRSALTSVSAAGSMQAPAPAGGQIGTTDTFTDFAYQALENLAFDKLDAGLDTRSDGRLGVLFHIVGRHDPPQHQEIAISWLDLIRRKFMGKKLPLPSDTGVDLTLDTTLNLDDLLKDYADYERLRSSPPVQR